MNFVFPLLTLPYLSRIIGVEKFGIIFFAQAIVSYFHIFTVFGFDLHIPREISIHRGNKDKIREIFWTVTYARLLLCLLSIIMFVLLLLVVAQFRNEWVVFAFSFIFIFGDIFQSLWFFQGMEEMSYIAIMNFISKVIYTICIFCLIKIESDYILVPLLYSLSQIFVGTYAMFVIIKSYKLFPVRCNIVGIFNLIKETNTLFMSNVSLVLNLKLPIVFLGILCGNIYVGYYSAAEKIISALRGIQNALNQTFYPYICKVVNSGDRVCTNRVMKKLFIIYISIGTVMSCFSYIFSNQIIITIFGNSFACSIGAFQILSFLFIIMSLSDIYIFQTMLPSGQKKEYAILTFVTCAIFMLLACIFIPTYKHVGAAFSLILSQLVTLVIALFFYNRKNAYYKFRFLDNYEN
jgi:PST family polysaccharide transporter